METQSANPNQSRYEVYERKIWKDKEGDREKRIIKWKRIKMEREKIEIIGMGGGGGGGGDIQKGGMEEKNGRATREVMWMMTNQPFGPCS